MMMRRLRRSDGMDTDSRSSNWVWRSDSSCAMRRLLVLSTTHQADTAASSESSAKIFRKGMRRNCTGVSRLSCT